MTSTLCAESCQHDVILVHAIPLDSVQDYLAQCQDVDVEAHLGYAQVAGQGKVMALLEEHQAARPAVVLGWARGLPAVANHVEEGHMELGQTLVEFPAGHLDPLVVEVLVDAEPLVGQVDQAEEAFPAPPALALPPLVEQEVQEVLVVNGSGCKR